MAHRLPRRSAIQVSLRTIVLAVPCVLASAVADAGCTVERTANNEIILRFGSACTSDPALQSRVKTDLLGAVSEQPVSGAGTAADGGSARGADRRSEPSESDVALVAHAFAEAALRAGPGAIRAGPVVAAHLHAVRVLRVVA